MISKNKKIHEFKLILEKIKTNNKEKNMNDF